MLSKRPGEILGPGDGNPDRLKGVARLELEPLGQPAQSLLDPRRVERLHPAEHLPGGLEHRCRAVEESRIGRDPVEEEAGEAGELSEFRDLLLDERRRTADELLVPVVALLAEIRDERVRIGLRRQSPWYIPFIHSSFS